MKEDLFKDIIIKFLDGHATQHEKGMLANWLKEHPDGEELFYYYLSSRENESPQYLPDLDTKIEEYKKFLRGEIPVAERGYPNDQYPATDHFEPWNYKLWVAASVVFLITASFYFLKDYFFCQTYTAHNGVVQSILLEDGSKVTLNANSSIKVPRDFMGHENREVWIKGEAFFEVSKKSNRMKFIVHTDNLDVEVLGTKFNVNNRRGKTEVMLAEGKVKLLAKDQQPLIMKPGEQVSLSDSQDHFQKQLVKPEKFEAWRSNMLVFENTPLAEVAEIIHDYYGVKMIVPDSLLGKRQFTGTLPNNDLDVILIALSTAYKIDIEQKGDLIILK